LALRFSLLSGDTFLFSFNSRLSFGFSFSGGFSTLASCFFSR